MASIKTENQISEVVQFILLHESDNILVCAQSVSAGTEISIDGAIYTLEIDIPLGHKIARQVMAIGTKVLRYGIAIGSITANVEPGEHIHSHNLQSDYIPAHGRDAVRIREIRS